MAPSGRASNTSSYWRRASATNRSLTSASGTGRRRITSRASTYRLPAEDVHQDALHRAVVEDVDEVAEHQEHVATGGRVPERIDGAVKVGDQVDSHRTYIAGAGGPLNPGPRPRTRGSPEPPRSAASGRRHHTAGPGWAGPDAPLERCARRPRRSRRTDPPRPPRR